MGRQSKSDGGAEETRLDLRDLLRLHLLSRRHREAPDTREYYEGPALAAASAFGIHLDKPPLDDDGLGDLLRATLAQLEEIGSPFDGLFEAPMPIEQLHQRYADRIAQANAQLNETLTQLAVDIVARLWRIYPDTTVSWDELATHGFELPPRTPDSFDDW